MITVEVNHNDLDYVQQRLGGLQNKAPKTLKDAVNKTAKETQQRLAEKAQNRYTEKKADFNRHVKIKPKATVSRPIAVIKAAGRPLTLPRFRVIRQKRSKKSAAQAEVLKGSGLKSIEGPRQIKAFLATAPNGTKMVFQRKGKDSHPLKGLYGSSVPKMLEKVYDGGVTSPGLKAEIERIYHENVEAAIGKVLNGG